MEQNVKGWRSVGGCSSRPRAAERPEQRRWIRLTFAGRDGMTGNRRELEGAGNAIRSSSSRGLVLVNEPSEDVPAPNTVESDDGLGPLRRFLDWRSLVKGAMGPMLVVMTDVDREDAFKVAAVHDQEPVEALAAYGADPALDERVRAWCPDRCPDRPDALGAEHFVERRRELAVAVVDQEPDRLGSVDEPFDDVACLLGGPLARQVRSDARQVHLPGREFDEHECVETAKQHGVDGEEVASDDPGGLRT